jgi:hypothetical protein
VWRRESARRLKRSRPQADLRANRTKASDTNNNAKTIAPARLIDPKCVCVPLSCRTSPFAAETFVKVGNNWSCPFSAACSAA